MVNRLWARHFGRGIVATPNDFGAMGEPPSHPELLDWLAVEFIEQGWSLKAMHRLMVTSAAYCQSSQVDFDNAQHARALEVDGGNRLLWHVRRTRLDGEEIRDSMLALAGRLDHEVYGPTSRPQLPEGVEPKGTWKPDASAADRDRRSIYVLVKRNFRFPLLDVFDLPDMHNSCPQRTATVTAPQALALLNGDFTLRAAQRWCSRLLNEAEGDVSSAMRAAFAEVLSKPATEEQLTAARRFLAEQASAVAAGGESSSTAALPEPLPPGMSRAEAAAMVDFCHALMNANEFLFVD
jgi:hypothetical protein